jgi:glycogen debranching enzyme
VYSVPRYGQLVYAGLQGWVSLLNKIRSANDMGHPLFDNLRQGNWQMDFIVERLRDCSALDGIRDWVVKYFTLVKKLPRHLIPKYFDKVRCTSAFLSCSLRPYLTVFIMAQVIMKLYLSARHYVIRYLSSEFVWKSTDPLVSELAVTGLQFIAKLRDTALISPLVARYDKPLDITMAAGLPHFTTGYMRAWGRDTFIALPGLLLTTGRFEEARSLLIGFASCLRHGLIPNLLDSGRNPRYNCRDAAWWFLQALQEYCGASKEGLSFLSKPEVVRLFPQDDSPTNNPRTARYDSLPVI